MGSFAALKGRIEEVEERDEPEPDSFAMAIQLPFLSDFIECICTTGGDQDLENEQCFWPFIDEVQWGEESEDHVIVYRHTFDLTTAAMWISELEHARGVRLAQTHIRVVYRLMHDPQVKVRRPQLTHTTEREEGEIEGKYDDYPIDDDFGTV